MQLNNEQLRAVMHGDGPMLVLAGPGSGKTAVLVNRLLHLVRDLRIDPGSILVLTFSRAAASEMQERFEKLAQASYPVTFGTFHAIFYHILRSQGLYQRAGILTKDKKIEYMKTAAAKRGIGRRYDLSFIERLTELVSLKKMGTATLEEGPENEEEKVLDLIYDDYDRLVKNEGYIDFDDMIADCLNMLKSNDRIRRKWQDRYRYILVDEFQDIDLRQYEVLKLLSGDRANVFCVGDDDQSIYSFRGAAPEVMKCFTADYGNVSEVRLNINYRCPFQVIKHAGKLIAHNSGRFDKDQRSIATEQTPCIIHRCFVNTADEAGFCAGMIGHIMEHSKGNKAGPAIGVLYRMSRSGDVLEEVLKNRGIPYRRKDKRTGFYEREWVKDIISYLKLALSDSREDMFRILNRPARGLPRDCIGLDTDMRSHMLGYFKDDDYRGRITKLLGDIDFIRGMTCFGAVNYILKGVGLLDHIKDEYMINLAGTDQDELITEILERARAHKGIKEWLKCIEACGEENGSVLPDENGEITGSCIAELSTIHSAKGLEYDNVFMIGLQEGVFPLKKCDDIKLLEEERRLFYVGMTRCRKNLFLTGIQRDEYGKRESRFVKEAGICDETMEVAASL